MPQAVALDQRLANHTQPTQTTHNMPAIPPATSAHNHLFTALDFAALGVISWMLFLLKEPPHQVLIYAWNPTLVAPLSLPSHQDSLAIFTLMLSPLAIIARKPLMSNLLLAPSFVSKLFAATFRPMFLKRRRMAGGALFAGVVALA